MERRLGKNKLQEERMQEQAEKALVRRRLHWAETALQAAEMRREEAAERSAEGECLPPLLTHIVVGVLLLLERLCGQGEGERERRSGEAL